MKTLLLKLCLFVCGIFLLIYFIVFLPANFYTFRTWESLIWSTFKKNPTAGNFYPNKVCQRDEKGDLGHGSKYEVIKKNIVWKTDKYGFRNDPKSVYKDGIVLVGDSNSVGSGTSQESILSYQISKKAETQVFNYSPKDIDEHFIKNLRMMNVYPKLVIFQIVERNIPSIKYHDLSEAISGSNLLLRGVEDSEFLQQIKVFKDIIFKKEPIRFIQSRIESKFEAFSMPTIIGAENMLFYSPSLRVNSISDEEIRNIVNTISLISTSLKRNGIDFIFVPVPNKETIYYELLPIEIRMNINNSDFLVRLKKELDFYNLSSIDLYSAFRLHAANGEKLYLPDDTHWNSAGIELAAEMIVQEISKKLSKNSQFILK